jgi:N-acetylglucosaminyldiphosphoundecaprenol N-acetyl-beta-D-mannosaminyltransferase
VPSEVAEGSRSGVPVARRFPVAGILVSQTTYADVTARVIRAAREGVSLVVAATSVHGLAMGAIDPEFGAILNSFDMLTPDGQPVRWALNALHDARLAERVYGPTLMRRICEGAADAQLSVYLYGSQQSVLDRLVDRLSASVPELRVAGKRSPPFRDLSPAEAEQDVDDIRASGARVVFVGLGCPRQERWAFEHRARLDLPIVCVGAAFDFHAGTLRQAPPWMQARGLEWLFRLVLEPRRLWWRYAKHIPIFVALVGRQYLAQRDLPLARPNRSLAGR